MSKNAGSLEDKLRLLRNEFLDKLPETISDINAQWVEVTNTHWEMESVFTLHRLTHNLAGSSATFGLMNVAETARDLDEELMVLLDTKQAPEQADIETIKQKLEALKQACAR